MPDAPDAPKGPATRAARWRARGLRALRRAGIVLGVFLGLTLVGAVTFHAACEGDAQALQAPAHDTSSLQARYPEYKRTEESTYLTTLEWYQVFSYQEYAGHVADQPPSRFPYFAAVDQSWSMYCMAYGQTEDTYPFNGGNHLMLGVIGVSFAAEYGLKGLYENTIGWLAEWDTSATPQDTFAAGVHAEYGEFIETDPWYAYPFGARAGDLWTGTSFDWSHPLRSAERRVFLSAELGAKASYATVIRVATGAIYGAPPALDYLWLSNASDEALEVPGVRVVERLGPGEAIITLPHYQGFTDAVPELARRGAHFEDVSGNAVLVATLQVPQGQAVPGEELLRQDVLVAPGTERVVLRVPVSGLDRLVLDADAQGARIEHLFDY